MLLFHTPFYASSLEYYLKNYRNEEVSLNIERKSFLKYLLKLHFHSNLIHRISIDLTAKHHGEREKNRYSRARDFHCKIELPLIIHAILIKAFDIFRWRFHITITPYRDRNPDSRLNDVKYAVGRAARSSSSRDLIATNVTPWPKLIHEQKHETLDAIFSV